MPGKLLFLDVDGVLNDHSPLDPDVMCGQIHKDKVALLNHILRETGAEMVLSSAWRYLIFRQEMNLVGMEWLLRSHGVLANRLIGITAPDTLERVTYNGKPADWPVENERGALIRRWLDGNRLGWPDGDRLQPRLSWQYVVLDDLDLGISAAGHPFVHVDGTVGLTAADAERAIRLLGRVTHA